MANHRSTILGRLVIVISDIVGIILAPFATSPWSGPIIGLFAVFWISLVVNTLLGGISLRSIRHKRISLGNDGDLPKAAGLAISDAVVGVALLVLHVIAVVDSGNWRVNSTILVMYAASFALTSSILHLMLAIGQLPSLLKAWYSSEIQCPACNYTFTRYGAYTPPVSSPKEASSAVPNVVGMEEGDRLITPENHE